MTDIKYQRSTDRSGVLSIRGARWVCRNLGNFVRPTLPVVFGRNAVRCCPLPSDIYTRRSRQDEPILRLKDVTKSRSSYQSHGRSQATRQGRVRPIQVVDLNASCRRIFFWNKIHVLKQIILGLKTHVVSCKSSSTAISEIIPNSYLSLFANL